jgi:hypothetical protein
MKNVFRKFMIKAIRFLAVSFGRTKHGGFWELKIFNVKIIYEVGWFINRNVYYTIIKVNDDSLFYNVEYKDPIF